MNDTQINAELLAACEAVVGRGYIENKHPAGQDYVCKSAIAKVRAALAKAEPKPARRAGKEQA